MGLPARIECDLTSADQVLFRAGAITAASFDCPVDHPRFAGGGPLSCHYLVFPRSATQIERDGIGRLVATPNLAVLYRPGDAYARRAISAAGDHCDYLAIDSGDNMDIGAGSAPISPGTYLRKRQLFERLRQGHMTDALEFEAAANELVAEALAAAWPRGATPKSSDAHDTHSRRRQRDRIEQVKALLAKAGAATPSLGELARQVDLAPSSLVRLFRAHTGYSVHQYALHLRLRSALELLPERPGDVADVAYELGFSHHSHFGEHFRRAFGLTPTEFVRDARRMRSN